MTLKPQRAFWIFRGQETIAEIGIGMTRTCTAQNAAHGLSPVKATRYRVGVSDVEMSIGLDAV
jgi:hypothetical protein